MRMIEQRITKGNLILIMNWSQSKRVNQSKCTHKTYNNNQKKKELPVNANGLLLPKDYYCRWLFAADSGSERKLIVCICRSISLSIFDRNNKKTEEERSDKWFGIYSLHWFLFDIQCLTKFCCAILRIETGMKWNKSHRICWKYLITHFKDQ